MSLNDTQTMRRDLQLLADRQKAWAERGLAEIEFAEELSKLEKTESPGWGPLTEKARQMLCNAIATGQGLPEAVGQMEEILSPIGKVAKSYTCHCVGHAHIDMNWLWSWPETVATVNDTFITVLKLMDEFPEFCYTQSMGVIYEIARDYCPQLFEQIKRRVKEGRWEIVAAHWVEGDKNLASGESLARHLLYTRQFFAREFGLQPEDMPVDWEPDTFGHAHTIPSIVSKAGVSRYYFCRGGAGDIPPVFWWKGPDGSRILANRETTWYNDLASTENARALLRFCEQTGIRDWLLVYGVGDHGGGPTRQDLQRFTDMHSWPIYPNFRFSTTQAYYSILEANGDKWPTLDRELNFEFTGCYTTQTLIKRANRLGENLGMETESAAFLAHRLIGRDYPTTELAKDWRDIVFSHFHDILPGSGISQTRMYNQGMFQRICASLGMIKTHSLRGIADKIDTSFAAGGCLPDVPASIASLALGAGQGRYTEFGQVSSAAYTVDGPRPVVIFNPTAWERQDIITANVWDAQTGAFPGPLKDKSFVVRTPDGGIIPAQRTGQGGFWGHEFVELSFPVSSPALGYSSYAIEEGSMTAPIQTVTAKAAAPSSMGQNFPHDPIIMENDKIRVLFDKSTGGIISLVDKNTGRDLADPARPMGLVEFAIERSRGMTAWTIGDPYTQITNIPLDAFTITQNGPYVASVEGKLKVSGSEVKIVVSLKIGQPMLEIMVSTRWIEIGTPEKGIPQLSIAFPTCLKEAKGRYEIPFGSIRRTQNQGEEVPSLRWAEISGKNSEGNPLALALLNDSKYGHSLDGNTLKLTLIRSSFDPDPLPEIGDHEIRMAIVPLDAEISASDLIRMGASFNHSLEVVNTEVHTGILPACSPAMMETNRAGVILNNIKKAEEDDGLIVRLYETEGQETTTTVFVNLMLGTIISVEEVDLLERSLPSSSAKIVDGGFQVRLLPHGITTVKVTLGR